MRLPTVTAAWNAGRTLEGRRNLSSGILFGASWSHHKSFTLPRAIHLYLGLWVVTVRPGATV